MTDITKCVNDECDLRESCYRYLAEGGEFQSYSLFIPTMKIANGVGTLTCEYFHPKTTNEGTGERCRNISTTTR